MNARIAIWLAVLLIAVPAQAQLRDREPHRPDRFAEPRPMPVEPMPVPMHPRDFRRDDFPVPGRLSREERRQLRQDIQDAGQDVYRRGPRYRPF
jgi:hypothetical protein